MKVVTIDFETYWSTDFSLTKMSFIEYIKSPLFEVISVAIKIGSGDTNVYFGRDVAPALQAIDWADAACVAHNGAEFDFPLLVWSYDVHPKLFVDTLHLARARHQSSVGGSLKKLSAHYGLPDKNNAALLSTKGKRLSDMSPQECADMGVYNVQDTANTALLFKIFKSEMVSDSEDLREVVKVAQWANKEMRLSDMTTRMICYPQLHCDTDLLGATLAEAEGIKEKQLLSLTDVLGVLDVEEVRAELASAPKFAAVLESMGVTPPRKISKTTGKETYALAKTDEEFTALLEHEDERVQMVTAARLGVKSTLLETRLAKMKTCAERMGGWMPVPLAYHAATTGRWGGRIWNPQNLPRISRNKDGSVKPKLTNALRMSLRAPEGYKIVVSDLSGIELRVNHYLWGVESTAKLYAADAEADLYRDFAATLFGKARSDVTKDERQLAKVAQLGLGYGAGAKTFQRVAKLMGGIDLDEDEARRVTETWRFKYIDIVTGWAKCNVLIQSIFKGEEFSVGRGLVKSVKGGALLPSGRTLFYPQLCRVFDETAATKRQREGFAYGEGRNKSKIYGGLMCENLVQGIARDVIAEQALTIWKTTGFYPALTVHDELVYVVPDAKAEQQLQAVNAVMRTPPAWLPGIVLWSEGDVAQNYGAAK